jgi:hypothetical protein
MHHTSSQTTQDALPMVVNTASLILVVIISIYLIYLARKNSRKIPCMAGMMAAMSNAMMSSLVIGTILGIMQMKMFIPTVVASVFGLVVGYLTGRSFGLISVIDGMIAGIMGGLMGAMLGVMIMGDHPTHTVLFIDILFIILTTCSIQLLRKEEID